MTGSTTTEPAAMPIDLEAVLAAMQDQLDDLAAVAEAQQKRIEALETEARKG
jgi:hypothetical protein